MNSEASPLKKLCAYCGQENRIDASYCRECGTDSFKSNEIKPAKASFVERQKTVAIWCVCMFGVYLFGSAIFSEPSYQVQTLSEWLDLHYRSPKAASIAIRKIGTAAVPWLVYWIDDTKTYAGWRKTLQIALQKLPFQIFKEKAYPSSESVEFAFSVLGSNASKAVPTLTRLAQGTNYATASHAISAMGYIGKPALPALLNLVTNDSPLRGNVIAALGKMDPENAPVIAPLLIDYLKDTNPNVRMSAATALNRIAPNPVTVTHAMINCLQNDSNVSLRCQAIFILAIFGDRPSAFQELLRATRDSSEEVRKTATNALQYLAPESLSDLNRK